MSEIADMLLDGSIGPPHARKMAPYHEVPNDAQTQDADAAAGGSLRSQSGAKSPPVIGKDLAIENYAAEMGLDNASVTFEDVEKSELGVEHYATLNLDMGSRGMHTQRFNRAIVHETKWAFVAPLM